MQSPDQKLVTEQQVSDAFDKLRRKCHDERLDLNHLKQILRFFTLSQDPVLEFEEKAAIFPKQGDLVRSCYIFKLRTPDAEDYTHGIYACMNKFVPRTVFDSLILKLLNHFTEGNVKKIKAVKPIINKYVSIFDYLSKLYGFNRNLLFKYTCPFDVIAEVNSSQINHSKYSQTIFHMKKQCKAIAGNIVAMPTIYEGTILNRILQMSDSEFQEYMRFNTLSEVVDTLCNDAYNYALQCDLFSAESNQLMEGITRKSIINEVNSSQLQQQVQKLLKQIFPFGYIHPSPFIRLKDSSTGFYGAMDGLLFDHRFLILILMISRWFAKVCLQKPENITNNQAHLALYGVSGAGKSLLLSSLTSSIPTYTYITNSNFQNPSILHSAMIYFGEFDSSLLVKNQYKDLFDIKSNIKIDLKNMNPEDVSANVPCIFSTNDDILTTLRQQSIRRNGYSSHSNQYSVDAAIRRLYLIPCKLGKFDILHKDSLEATKQFPEEVKRYGGEIDKTQYKIVKIFNLIFAFALFQTDIQDMYIHQDMQPYIKQVVSSFIKTLFGQFYHNNKGDVDFIIIQLEQLMGRPDINDTEYAMHFAATAERLGGLIQQFIQSNSKHFIGTQRAKDQGLSQPTRIKFLSENDNQFKKILQDPVLFYYDLNTKAFALINNQAIAPFVNEHFNFVEDGDSVDSMEVEGGGSNIQEEEKKTVPGPAPGSNIFRFEFSSDIDEDDNNNEHQTIMTAQWQ